MQERKTGCICELDPATNEPLVANYDMCPVHKSDAPDPKRTAQELVSEYFDGVYGGIGMHQAQDCAKIAIDKILNVLEPFQRHEYGKVLILFYQEVKKQIEQM